jgi:hypothetical protein
MKNNLFIYNIMLTSVKHACHRQAAIDENCQKNKPNTTQSDPVIVNHFEKMLNNWVNIYTEPDTVTLPNGEKVQRPTRPVDEKSAQQISVPIIPNVDAAKYDEWTTTFTNAGYVVKRDAHRLTINMPPVTAGATGSSP